MGSNKGIKVKDFSDVELAKLETKAKFSGWDRSEGSTLVLRLIEEVRLLKKTIVGVHAETFIKTLDQKIDDYECVIIEIETLKSVFPEGNHMVLDAFVDDVSGRAKWESVINQKDKTVMFYKKKSEMGVGSSGR